MTTRLTRPPGDRKPPRLHTRAEADAAAERDAARRAAARADEARADEIARVQERARHARRAWLWWRVEQVFAAAIPAALIAAIVAGLAVLILAGCAERQAQGYTTRDEIRASCASAAHAYTLATERTRAGAMSPETFAAVSAGYDGVVATCRRILSGDAAALPADAARIGIWTQRTEEVAR